MEQILHICENIVISKREEGLENFSTLIKKYLSENYR